METKNEIVIFETEDNEVKLSVNVENDTVWLSANQMAVLFERDEKTIRKHINHVFLENEVEKDNNTQKMRVDGVKQPVPFYTLDVIISVGYRVKSKRGVEFRRWANSVLKQYILKGYAVNDNRIKQLGEVIRIMRRTENELDSKQVLSVIERYSHALDLLDSYDHQNMHRPGGNAASYILKVVAAIIIENGKVFATQRGYGEFKDGWEFPGGKIEPGETPEEAIVREIKEELDTEVEVLSLLDTVEYDYPNFHLSMDCFICKIIAGDLVLKEHEAAKWLTKENLDSVEWLPADQGLIPKIIEICQQIG